LNTPAVTSASRRDHSGVYGLRRCLWKYAAGAVTFASLLVAVPASAQDVSTSDRIAAPAVSSAEFNGTTNTAHNAQDPAALAAEAKKSLQQTLNSVPSADSAGPQTWSDDYQSRMGAVMSNNSGDTDRSLADWWHSQSLSYLWNNRHAARSLTVSPLKHPRVRQYVAEHTLPPYGTFDQDVYDQRPRAVTVGPVVQASAEESGSAGSDSGTSEHADGQTAARNVRGRLTRDITEIQPNLSYALRGINEEQLPDDFHEKSESGEYEVREHQPTVMQWAPTNLYHHPLYFEDPALERYGHTYHPLVQPFASTGRFAVQLVGLPYQMTLQPVHAKEYTLGWYRPGDCAPKKHYQIPFNEEAALMQAAVASGLILIIP
jgi:hypothetical protein